jgi:hypothetical protein
MNALDLKFQYYLKKSLKVSGGKKFLEKEKFLLNPMSDFPSPSRLAWEYGELYQS